MNRFGMISWVALAVVIPVSTAGCRDKPDAKEQVSGPGPRVESPDRLDDSKITEAVRRKLGNDPGIELAGIGVKTVDGIVELTGKAPDLLTKERIATLAALVRGVRAVSDRLELALEPRPDHQIRENVENNLALDPAADVLDVRVTVKDSVVTLRGEVQSWQEKQLAEYLAKGVDGVRGVVNELGIEYKVRRPDPEIREDVRARLRWDALVRDGLLDVRVENGTVKLSGFVGSLAEKLRAYGDAWVAGVQAVDDSGVDVRWWAKDEDLTKSELPAKNEAELRDAIEDAMLYDPRVDTSGIDVEVSERVATLKGKVNDARARAAAEELARNTVGVMQVVNGLEVAPKARADDETIEKNVRTALSFHPVTDAYQIQVDAKSGKVELKGAVETAFEKAQAESIARGMVGVTMVDNELTVRRPSKAYVFEYLLGPQGPYVVGRSYLPSKPTRADGEIAEEIREEMRWSPFVDADEVNVKVVAGKATLTGTVDSWAEARAAAENAFEGGAIAVDSRLVVE